MSPRITITEHTPGTLAAAIEGFADFTREYGVLCVAIACALLVLSAWRRFHREDHR